MSDDPTKEFPPDQGRIDRLIEVVQGMSAELHEVKTRLEGLEKTVAERAYDTKPIWERALAEIAETRSELAETRTEIAEMRTEMRDSFRKLNKQMELLAKDVLDVRADERILERRVDNLESKIS